MRALLASGRKGRGRRASVLPGVGVHITRQRSTILPQTGDESPSGRPRLPASRDDHDRPVHHVTPGKLRQRRRRARRGLRTAAELLSRRMQSIHDAMRGLPVQQRVLVSGTAVRRLAHRSGGRGVRSAGFGVRRRHLQRVVRLRLTASPALPQQPPLWIWSRLRSAARPPSPCDRTDSL